MNKLLAQLIQETVATLRSPRAAARRVMAIEMPRQARWQVLILISVISAILAYVSLFVSAIVNGVDLAEISGTSPFVLALSQTVVLVLSVFAIDIFGRRAGGTGQIDDAILLVAWVQIVLAVLQVAQIMFLIVAPSIALMLGFAGMVLLFVLLTIFVAELHGFKSVGAVFIGVLVVMLLLASVLNFLFRLFGFDMLGIV